MDEAGWVAVFGPKTDNAGDHAGAISFTDARLLAFPVGSLKGVFAWVTCPEALRRLRRDLGLAAFPALPAAPVPASNTAIVAEGSPLLQGRGLVLEEFAFEAQDGADRSPAGSPSTPWPIRARETG
jgi:CRISPR-associated protein Cmr4